MASETYRILLVEDNSADAYLFRKALEGAALNVDLTVIEDGAEALALIRGEGKYEGRLAPDLAVLDLNVPKSDGTEMLTAMRANRDYAEVPVVITSSSPAPTDPSKMKELRVERYIRKPPDLDEFLKIGAALKDVLLKSKAALSKG